MVVSEDDSRAVILGGIGNDWLQREVHPRIVTFMTTDVEAARLIVDVRDPQGLAGEIIFGEAAGEKLPCDGKPIELQRKFGTLVPHRLGLTERAVRFDLNRVGFGDRNHPLWTN